MQLGNDQSPSFECGWRSTGESGLVEASKGPCFAIKNDEALDLPPRCYSSVMSSDGVRVQMAAEEGDRSGLDNSSALTAAVVMPACVAQMINVTLILAMSDLLRERSGRCHAWEVHTSTCWITVEKLALCQSKLSCLLTMRGLKLIL